MRLKSRLLTILISLLSVTADFALGQEIHTLTAGTLTVAVTTEAPESEFDPQLWIRQYIEEFADKNQLSLSWVVVPFNESWLLASSDKVDLVATNVASFADRAHPGASFSDPFLYERRALRIKARDQGKFKTLNDFVGRKVGAIEDYKYSKALISYEKDWTFEELNGFLIKPAKHIKGTKMAYAGLRKESDRASVIKYLNANSDNPLPLP